MLHKLIHKLNRRYNLNVKIAAKLIFALVLINLISWTHDSDIIAKTRDIDPGFIQEGEASWYGPGFQGRKTANGERFDTHEMTAAHKTLPFNTLVKVVNLSNDMSVVVRINDRGPFIRGRIIDLSKAAKTEIGMDGLAPVRIEIFNPEEEEETESELNNSLVNLFEDEFPVNSKIFVQFPENSGQSSDYTLTRNELNLLFNSSRIKIKVLTSDVEFVDTKIYQEVADNSSYNYFDVTKKIRFIKGFTIQVARLIDEASADQLITKLESENFNTIFLEEIVGKDDTYFKVYVGNYETLESTNEDIKKLFAIDEDLKMKILKIGS
ncbi:MAG: septal ring lytic transglycosylase RlpA family protein [Ignavibacteria bacterium]|nr:septal ring lytic transglycosylase RlpA family protein [Ignavibacteria bacterium]